MARWYSVRGIPYRRGYLFNGPPGTSKTSLSFTLAGIFRLSIYCVSLSEVGLTETGLSYLFNSLPERCVVLLEDIDSAGIRRQNAPTTKKSDKDAVVSITTSDTVATGVEGTDTGGKKTEPPVATEDVTPNHSSISLAGLLNIIDGAASHEVNTASANFNVLTRPGRIDFRIGFTLATRGQIREIFCRM